MRFGLPPKQITGVGASLQKMTEIDWLLFGLSKLCLRRKALNVRSFYCRSGGLLDLPVGSIGTTFFGDGK